MQSLYFENGRRWEIVKEDPALDFGLHDGSVDLVG